MNKKLSIRFWIIAVLNTLLIPTILLVSFLFYREFKSSLDERVLLQLTSIKRLKRVQIENWLEREWESFISNKETNGSTETFSKKEVQAIIGDQISNGIYDVTPKYGDGRLKLFFVHQTDENSFHGSFKDESEINKILQERSGMGQTGESYIVGEDFRLRTKSRFLTDTKPYEIVCKSQGVLEAIKRAKGSGIILDYRGKEVYSAYRTIYKSHLKWVILSEIDTEEALQPLQEMKRILLFILTGAVVLVFISSLVIAKVITTPILRMKEYLHQMSSGNYDFEIKDESLGIEIEQMQNALADLLYKITATINFSREIGKMNLDVEYELLNENDSLGKSLLTMQERLKAANESEMNRQREMRVAIVSGQEKERQRLAKELHDGLGPLLTHLKLLIESQNLPTEQKVEIKKIIDDTVTEVRRMTYNLMPQSLLDFGVAKAIQNLVQTIQPVTKTKIEFIYHKGLKNDKFTDEVNICLYRIAQECLNNGIKHANAEHIIIVLTDAGNNANLYYSDDGVGFSLKNSNKGSGLNNIQARVEALYGKIEINSDKEGTTIDVNIPI